MQELNRSRLLKFLSKPRYVRDVTEHFGVSAELANYHLTKALRCGDVLVGESPLPQIFSETHDEQRSSAGAVYVARNSPFLVGNVPKLAVHKVEQDSNSNTDVVSVKFLQNTPRLPGTKIPKSKGRAFPSKRKSARIKSETGLVPRVLNDFLSKAKLVKRRSWSQRLTRESPSDRSEHKMLSQTEKLRLFQAISDQPLPFLDIHRRFGISKRTVGGLVKNGFLQEEWGPNDIGVRFGLTDKGRSYLKELKVVARFEPKRRESTFIRLKHRIFA